MAAPRVNFNKETVMVYNSKNVNKSNIIAYDQAAPAVFHTNTATRTHEMRDKMTSTSKGNGDSHQRSVYEIAGNVTNYDTVRSSSIPVNASSSGIETVTNAVKKNNPDIAVVEENSCQVPFRTTLKNEPVARPRKINGNAAETEYAEVRGAVINHSFPPPQRTNSERNYYNCTAVGKKEEVLGEIVQSAAGNQNHNEGCYVDWAPESDCAYGEVTLVDNDLYAEEVSV